MLWCLVFFVYNPLKSTEIAEQEQEVGKPAHNFNKQTGLTGLLAVDGNMEAV